MHEPLKNKNLQDTLLSNNEGSQAWFFIHKYMHGFLGIKNIQETEYLTSRNSEVWSAR